jgi:hypothetical protein
MTQYDAGPGDWSDREWESPDKRPKTHARRRRVTLPPWALLVLLVGIVILLCVSLVVIIRAIRGGGDRETPTPRPTSTAGATSTATPLPVTPTETVTPTATVQLPIGGTEEPSPPAEIGPGATVVVQGTLGAGLNLREEPRRQGRLVSNAKEGTKLTVVDGPQDGDGYTWWKVRTPDGKEGWGAANWLVLKTEP